MPFCTGLFDGTGFCAEVVSVEWKGGISDFSFCVLKIAENKFSIFGKIQFGVERYVVLLDDAGTKKLIVARVHAPVEGQEFYDICFMGFVFSAGFEFCSINVFGGVGFYEMKLVPTDGNGSAWMI